METRVRGRVEYLPTYAEMQAFTAGRTETTGDELWLCEHPPVFTQGLAGRAEHVMDAGDIPVVQANRGGQVTYHGPGQVVAYPLVDMRRAGYFIKECVYRIEEAVIRTLAHYGVTGHRVKGAPGIYVRLDDPFGHRRLDGQAVIPDSIRDPWIAGQACNDAFQGLGKIAALGLKVSRHCTYHGVALNVAMDLEPFSRIDPCGYPGLQTVDLSTIGVSTHWDDAARVLGQKLHTHLAA
ncbi:MAG: lipoyl(octanoyl) transferase LipB [Pseudomonadota bacterium]